MATKPSTTTTAPPPPQTTSTTLKNLSFEKKNTHLLHIPSSNGNSRTTYRIAKRPIPRAPIASPYAGSHIPKPVYISSKTPFMSAVKRVQKLLRMAERRAMAPLIGGKGKRRLPYNQQHQHGAGRGGDVLEKCQQRLREEKVLVKATGRAIEKALSVGRWFEEGRGGGGEEYEVVVKTGSVCVVDDIVEEDVLSHQEDEEDGEDGEDEEDRSIDPDITMSMTTTTNTTTNSTTNTQQDKELEGKAESKNQRRRRRKRERIREQRLKAFVDEDGEAPESRTRWVNMVEIAINMK